MTEHTRTLGSSDSRIRDLEKELTGLKAKLGGAKVKLSSISGRRDAIEQTLVKFQKRGEELSTKAELLQRVRVFLVSVLEAGHESVENVFGNIGTAALQQIYAGGYKLKCEFRKPKTKDAAVNPGVDINIVQPWYHDGKVEEKMTGFDNAEGGGIKDLIALVLRVAMVELHSPELNGPLFLDESLQCLYADRIPAAGEFLRKLSRDSDRQIVMITHLEGLTPFADRLFSFSKAANTSMVKEINQNEKEDTED